MKHLSRRLAACALILAYGAHAEEMPPANPDAAAPPAWPVSTAPARFTIEPDKQGVPAILSWIKLYLPDPAWEKQPLRVFTDTGVAVGSDLLWGAPGEPVTLLFDSSSGAKSYKVYIGSNWPPMHLSDTHAGVWLETRAGDGRVIKTLPDMLDAWQKSAGSVLGRAIVPGVFEGGNRFGPQNNLFLHAQGWFITDKPEHLGFAIVSVDSSFLAVDGKEVVEWPGDHDWGYDGRVGPPQGGVDVAPGVHVVDYYNAYRQREGGRPPVLLCLSVNGGPFADWTMLTPDKEFFRAVLHDHATAYELQAATGAPTEKVPPLAFEWTFVNQSPINTDYADLGLIGMQFTCLSPPAGTLIWTFDDGTTAQGPNPTHIFPRPGLRVVQLTLKDGDKTVATVTRTIAVHLSWSPIVHSDPYLEPSHETDLMARDPATLSAPDLSSVFAVLGAFQQSGDLVKLTPSMVAKMKDVADADLPFLAEALRHFVHDDRDHFAEQEQLLHALIDRTAGATSPPLTGIANQSRLVLAQLLVKTSDQTDGVHQLIDAIDPKALHGEEPRALEILRGDLLLATGDVEGARKKYREQTGDPQGADARSSIRRTAKIGQARTFIEKADYDAAEDALREVSWQAPIEKLAPDWALTRLKLYEAENLPKAAYYWARRLLPVINAGGRSELLYQLTDLATAQNDPDLAHKTLDELLKKHPYSEEAARAKEKWPQAN
jgi:TolA-binding protein